MKHCLQRTVVGFLAAFLFALPAIMIMPMTGKSQQLMWMDTFDDETRISSKYNVIIQGGSVSLGLNFTGMNWRKRGVVVDIGSPGGPDGVGIGSPSVIYEGGMYKMWYSGVGTTYVRILYATSSDGNSWTKHGVVLDVGSPGSFDDLRASSPMVIKSGNRYMMWYTGESSSFSGYRILHATSVDGVNWVKYPLNGGVVLGTGGAGSDYELGSAHCYVLYDSGLYRMWYSAFDGATWRILYATSPDGGNWTRRGRAIDVGNPGDYDAKYVYFPSVNKLPNGTYEMWYSGYGGLANQIRVLYATSTDGVGSNWQKRGLALEIGSSGDPDDVQAFDEFVLVEPTGRYRMWYQGYDGVTRRILLADEVVSGSVVSESIESQSMDGWNWVYVNKTEFGIGCAATVTILDSTSRLPISGFEMLAASVIDISSIDMGVFPSISLQGNLECDSWQEPELLDWTVVWSESTPPIFSGLSMASDDGTGGNVTLSWNPASDPHGPVFYNIYIATTSSGQDFGAPNYTTQAVEFQVSGLENGVRYYFVVRAEDNLGNEDTNLVERSAIPTTSIDLTPPIFLGLESAVDSGTGGTVALAWSQASDPDTIECNSDPSIPISYNIYYATTPSGENFASPNLTVSGTQATISGLENGVTYYFVVRAVDAAGNEEDNTVERSAIPTTPTDSTPPQFEGLNMIVIDNETGDITLIWSVAIDPDSPECNADPSTPIRYNIYISQAPGTFDFSHPIATTSQQQYPFLDLERGVTYYFVVRAEDNAGNEEKNSVIRTAQLRLLEKGFNIMDYWWLMLVVIILILLAVIFILLAKRERKGEPTEAKEDESLSSKNG